jgi:hypothetical protein
MAVNTAPTTGGTHVTLASGQWILWRPILLRAAGFPAAGVSRLAAPDLARAADTFDPTGGAEDREQYVRAYEEGMLTLGDELRGIARDEDFRRALTWQNHQAVDTAVQPLLRRDPRTQGRNSKYRQHEELLANYWQRYCVKNDSVGFFGPVGWGRFDPDRPVTRLMPGPRLIAHAEVFFEAWPVDRLAAKVELTGEDRRRLKPHRRPFVRIDGDVVRIPGARDVTLSAADLAVLGRCDGVLRAEQIARDVARAAVVTEEAEVYAILDRLRRRRLVEWHLRVPLSIRPDQALRRALRGVDDGRDGGVSANGLAALDRLDAGREAVRSAADDAGRLAAALHDLDATFEQLTDAAPNRNPGKTYGGRTLVYHDALRDLDLAVGRDVLEALAPLELLLRAARWLTHGVGEALTALLRELVDAHLAEHGRLPTLAWLWTNSLPGIHSAEGGIATGVCAEFRRRWQHVLRWDGDARRVHYRTDDLAAAVAECFDAPAPGWTGALYSSPDVMVAAQSPEAFRGGDFTLVLGELHLAVNTLRNAFQVEQHPDRRELFACLDAETPGPRLHPMLPKENAGRLSARTHPALIRPEDFLVALMEYTAEPDRPHVLRAADLVVEPDGGRLLLTEPDGRRFDLLDVYPEVLMNLVGDSFALFGAVPHTPRLTIDRLVVARETWSFALDELPFAGDKYEAIRYAAVRRWRAEQLLPDQVFATLANGKKPFYVDFDSPVYVNLLVKAVRSAQGGAAGRLELTEMLPTADDLWLSDIDGARYTSELRLTAVDRSGLEATRR